MRPECKSMRRKMLYCQLVIALALSAFAKSPATLKSSFNVLPVVIRANESKPTIQPKSVFHEFELSVQTPKADGDTTETVVFAKGQFCPARKADTPESSCMVTGEHENPSKFSFKYPIEMKDVSIEKPSVGSNNQSVVKSAIQHYTYDKSKGTGSFEVYYSCRKGGTALMTMSMNVSETKNVKIEWKKRCGSGPNSLTSLVPNGLSAPDSDAASVIHESGPMQESTTVELVLKYPQTFVKFRAPHLTSDNKDIGVQLRGAVQSGSASVTSPPKFTVLYSCKTIARGKITLTVPIPPWDDAMVTWTKNCGGSQPRRMVITTGSNTVFNKDGVLPKFKVTPNTKLNKAIKSGIFHLNADTSDIEFIIENIGNDPLQIQNVVTTVSAPKVLVAQIVNSRSMFNGNYLLENGEITLKPNSKVKVAFKFICLSRGYAMVLVTLPIVRYKSVEFGLYKDCARPQTIHHSGFLRTAPSLMMFASIALVVAGVGLYRIYRNRQASGGKYTRVRVSG